MLGETDADSHRFTEKTVLLTGEATTLVTANGVEIACAALRLLVRTCRNVSIAVPVECEALRSMLEKLADEIAISPVTFLHGEVSLKNFDAILSIGTEARSGLPWTVINSNGWRARVSSGMRHLAGDCSQENSIGALGAACLGMAEVFKRLIVLRENKGELLDGVSFSFWSYSIDGEDPGPVLPAELALNLLLVGGGAIGNGIAYLLQRLPVTGCVTVVDNQTYGKENWGTCICLPAKEFEVSKAEYIAGQLRAKVAATPKEMDVAHFARELGKTLPYPSIAVNGLDNIDARHEVQRLWPDIIIDGAIGSDLSCQVSCHPWTEDTACLLCVFRRPTTRAKVLASRATGLDERFVDDNEAVITQQHVDAAPEEKKTWLAARIGQKVCSVVSEAMAQMLSADPQKRVFAPSVPFVACFSACMVVTELVRYLSKGRTYPKPRYQLNLLWGPQRGTDYPESRRPDCFCVERRQAIDTVKKHRLSLSPV